MTTSASPVSRYLAPSLLALCAVLAGANWYLEPGQATRWTAALLLLSGIALVLRFSSHSVVPRHATDSIRHGVVSAAFIMAVAWGLRLADTLRAFDDAGLSQRLTMAILGGFFVFTGNALPKMLTPLSERRCNGAKDQALRRFSGWTWVLTGLAFAFVWLVLPLDVAKPVSVAVIAAGVVAVMTRIVQMRQTA